MMAAMANPKVMAAMQQCMGNPMAMMQFMDDPEVGPVLQKLMGKMMGGGGMPGMPGMGGMGGMPGGMVSLADSLEPNLSNEPVERVTALSRPRGSRVPVSMEPLPM